MSEAKVFAPPPGFTRVKLEVQWQGGNFVGWQSQAAGRSVQGTLHAALSRLGEAQRPVAAGRTDAGVHALNMPLHVDMLDGSLRAPIERLPRALNALLPRDVAVLDAAPAPLGFHARFSCRSRSYLYRVLQSSHRSPLEEGRALHVPQPLDLDAMRQAAHLLTGRHDYAAFATQEERSTLREVYALELARAGPVLEVRVRGESFLRHMVRALVGTLLLVGEGKLVPQDVQTILQGGQRRLAGRNVSPAGLYFLSAEYGEPYR